MVVALVCCLLLRPAYYVVRLICTKQQVEFFVNVNNPGPCSCDPNIRVVREL